MISPCAFMDREMNEVDGANDYPLVACLEGLDDDTGRWAYRLATEEPSGVAAVIRVSKKIHCARCDSDT